MEEVLSAAAVEAERMPAPGELTRTDREILDFAGLSWKYAGAKESAIRARFGFSPTMYYARLGRLLEDPAALAYAPMLVRRLVRLRDARRSVRVASG